MAAPISCLDFVNEILTCKKYKGILALLKGLRNGAVYGVKIRAPHALVMTFLFRNGSFFDKLRIIWRATKQHSKNLASFVFLYKSLVLLMKWYQNGERQIHSFIAAFIGGYYIWGVRNPVNMQINLYLFSRILFGLAKVGVKKGYLPEPKEDYFPLFSAIVWGVVLWLFEYHQETLQDSLQNSMTYLYHDSNKWNDINDFLFYNKPGIR